jgi:hypothetical protein
LAVLLAGCAAADRPELPPVAASAAGAASPAPVAQTVPRPALTDQAEMLRAALGTWPQCRAEIMGFVGLASLARELGEEGEVFSDAIDDLSDRVADCINDKGDDEGLIWS